MNERERLKELLLSSDPIKERDLDDDWGDGELDEIAYHLLANGVILSPCKVGDTVYCISNTRVKEAVIYEIYIGKDNHMSFQIEFDCDEDCDGCPFDSWSQSYCGEWDCGGEYGNTMIVANDFGKTVFLTKEEAEKVLAERNKE